MNVNVAFYNGIQIFRIEFEIGRFEKLRKSVPDTCKCQIIVICNLKKNLDGA